MQVEKLSTEQAMEHICRDEEVASADFGLVVLRHMSGVNGQYLLIDNAGGQCGRVTLPL